MDGLQNFHSAMHVHGTHLFFIFKPFIYYLKNSAKENFKIAFVVMQNAVA